MKIVNVKYSRKITKEEKSSLGQYSNEELLLEGTISEGENVDMSILSLMERVHIHLDIPFHSPVLERAKEVMKAAKKDGLPESDTIPSDPQLDRPQKVDDAKEELKNLKARGKDADSGRDKPTKDKPKKTAGTTGKKKQSKAKEPVEETKKEEKEEKVVEKKVSGTPYDNTKSEHKAELARILDEVKPEWRKLPKEEKKALSSGLVGKIMFTKSGDLSAQFHKDVAKACE